MFTHSDHTHLVIFIITLLVASVTSQTIEFEPSLNDTIYINVSDHVISTTINNCTVTKDLVSYVYECRGRDICVCAKPLKTAKVFYFGEAFEGILCISSSKEASYEVFCSKHHAYKDFEQIRYYGIF